MGSRTRHTSIPCPSFLKEGLYHVPRQLKEPTQPKKYPQKIPGQNLINVKKTEYMLSGLKKIWIKFMGLRSET